ncbi:hypothetical protein GCM10009579_58550 [Streptomyces javensis]|uniref:Uncharacterized protein n=1 Tax=Streptomyces javensis TaxID=114698 RepID=A0ABP4HXL4_9ACTN
MFTANGTAAWELAAVFAAGVGAARLTLAPARLPAAIPATAVRLTSVLVTTFGRMRFLSFRFVVRRLMRLAAG